jgi:acetoin utilization deacetylase AcuC-like enzyme
MKCSYHPGYQVALPTGHPFPISKFPLLKDQLLAEGLLTPDDIVEPEPIDFESLELVHTREYLDKLKSSGLSTAEQRRLGLPWSDALWLRSRLASGGTLLAARMALQTGLAGNLAGGTHHAFPDHGEGFCVVNDVAIAVAKLRAEGVIERAAIVDLDVHQGNGTAVIFEDVDEVFTFSMHGERNYPAVKMRSNLDVALPDGAGDAEYLAALQLHLPRVLDSAAADIAFYLAGVDVAAGDRYGRLALTDEGIRLRDRLVIETVRSRGVPLVIVLAGGYAATRARTAELHAHVFREAVTYERRSRRGGSAEPRTQARQPSNCASSRSQSMLRSGTDEMGVWPFNSEITGRP